MSDDPDRQREHWRELAELLGLNPDAPQDSEKPKPHLEAAARVPPEVHAPARSEPVPAVRGEPLKDDFEGEPRSVSPPEEPEQVQSARERENIAPPAQERDEWRPPARDEERPRRGKGRRGGRGGSERKEFSSGGAEGDTEARDRQSADDDEDQGASDPRGRERSPEPLEEEPMEEVESPSVTVADDEIDEEDTLSDWNVPSWNELIASLYRPERPER
jgi:hypothetical protein